MIVLRERSARGESHAILCWLNFGKERQRRDFEAHSSVLACVLAHGVKVPLHEAVLFVSMRWTAARLVVMTRTARGRDLLNLRL